MSRDRKTDSLLQPGRGHTPSYGINEEEDSINDEKEVEVHHSTDRVWTVAVFSLIACLGSVVIGMSLGYSTNTLAELSTLYNGGDDVYGIEKGSTEASLFGAFGPLGALFGGPAAWPLSERFGRKPALLLGAIPGVVGWVAIAISNLLPTRDGFLAFFYVGRVLSGFASGWSIFCISVYITEISTPKLRGLFGNCNQLFITVGIFTVEALGFKPSSFLKYTDVALIAAGVLTLFAFLLLFVVETPSWLYKKGMDLEGNRTLNFLRGPNANIPREIRGIRSIVDNAQSFTIVDQLKAFKNRWVYLPFILVLGLMFFQQFSGINAAVFYSSQIFSGAKVSNPTLISLLAVGLTQIFATFLSVVLVDLLGRKILLTLSSSGMFISSAGLGVYFLIFNHYCESELGNLEGSGVALSVCHHTNFGGLAIACVVVFIVSFSLGWGPITWSMMSELLPLQVRGLAGAFSTFVNWTFAFIITLAFSGYTGLVTPKFAWWSFSFVMLASIFFVLFFLPETKGRKLEEIEEHFREGHIIYNPCKRERRN
jgi:facilitated trehalose transporter